MLFFLHCFWNRGQSIGPTPRAYDIVDKHHWGWVQPVIPWDLKQRIKVFDNDNDIDNDNENANENANDNNN